MGVCNRSLSFSFKSRASKAVLKKSFVGLVLAIAALPLLASELIEISTIGKTTEASKYYSKIKLENAKVDPKKVDALLRKAKRSISEDVFFPLNPTDMQPGVMKGYKFKSKRNLKPFAVVGSDPLSMEWLGFRFDKLKELKAPIYVVQAESMDTVRALASKYQGLNFVPSTGEGLGKELNVGSYPFLVTSTGVWQ